jgi:hypothetical protein
MPPLHQALPHWQLPLARERCGARSWELEAETTAVGAGQGIRVLWGAACSACDLLYCRDGSISNTVKAQARKTLSSVEELEFE